MSSVKNVLDDSITGASLWNIIINVLTLSVQKDSLSLNYRLQDTAVVIFHINRSLCLRRHHVFTPYSRIAALVLGHA